MTYVINILATIGGLMVLLILGAILVDTFTWRSKAEDDIATLRIIVRKLQNEEKQK